MPPVTRIVLSGCSGGGKSTLLSEMNRRGCAIKEEAGRRVVASGIDPTREPVRFGQTALSLALEDYDQAGPGLTLYDRSFLDLWLWLDRLGALDLDQKDLPFTRRYAPVIFMVPDWPDIYVQDRERRHGLQEALAEYQSLCERLPEFDYRLETVPRLGVAERADWLEQRLEAWR